jgi:hypothetical protein
MSNVIDFFERMGQDAQLRHASQSEVELALAREQIDPELQAAILAKDRQKLEALLDGGSVCCALFPGKEEDEDEDEDEESPSREGEEIAAQYVFRDVVSVA